MIRTYTPLEESLKQKIQEHFDDLGFTESNLENNKDKIRYLHRLQRDDRLIARDSFIIRNISRFLYCFASGNEIEPEFIKPVVERIFADTWQYDLFKFASLTWSVPVSGGFGRRMRFLVWDAYNDKLIGLIAIGDPVFSLSVRDKFIGWDFEQRTERLVNIMDAFVLGALPPYNTLLAGKMVACFLRSREIYDEFIKTYENSIGTKTGYTKKAKLLVVTTSSSMGRSSVYNRLKLDNVQYLKSLGYTKGWGHFHISDDLFKEMREYLKVIGHHAYKLGYVTNWKKRTIDAALKSLGFKQGTLHGIQREVFFCNLASNANEILCTGKGEPDISSLLSTKEIADLALERWILPRAKRNQTFLSWNKDNIIDLFENNSPEKQRLCIPPSIQIEIPL